VRGGAATANNYCWSSSRPFLRAGIHYTHLLVRYYALKGNPATTRSAPLLSIVAMDPGLHGNRDDGGDIRNKVICFEGPFQFS
jgi:hypothetical protein